MPYAKSQGSNFARGANARIGSDRQVRIAAHEQVDHASDIVIIDRSVAAQGVEGEPPGAGLQCHGIGLSPHAVWIHPWMVQTAADGRCGGEFEPLRCAVWTLVADPAKLCAAPTTCSNKCSNAIGHNGSNPIDGDVEVLLGAMCSKARRLPPAEESIGRMEFVPAVGSTQGHVRPFDKAAEAGERCRAALDQPLSRFHERAEPVVPELHCSP